MCEHVRYDVAVLQCRRAYFATISSLCLLSFQFSLQIGKSYVIDPMMDEESCSQCRVISSVTQTGHVTCTKKLGSGSLLVENMVDMITVRNVICWIGLLGVCLNEILKGHIIAFFLDTIIQDHSQFDRNIIDHPKWFSS